MQISPALHLAAALALAAGFSSCRTTPGADFLAADANKDGVIDAGELDDHVAARFMAAYDANGDGGISFQEWGMVNPEADKAKFARRDTNKDGKIDMAELVVVVRENPTFGNLMQSIDANGDGVAQPSEAANFRKHMPEL